MYVLTFYYCFLIFKIAKKVASIAQSYKEFFLFIKNTNFTLFWQILCLFHGPDRFKTISIKFILNWMRFIIIPSLDINIISLTFIEFFKTLFNENTWKSQITLFSPKTFSISTLLIHSQTLLKHKKNVNVFHLFFCK